MRKVKNMFGFPRGTSKQDHAHAIRMINGFFLPNAKSSEKIVIACSGGIDSTCMLHICKQWKDLLCEKLAASFLCVYVNHCLRPTENKKEITFLSDLCSDWGFDFAEVNGKVEKGPGLQARARNIRYEALKSKGQYILTAHTKSDDIETMMMRLLQGRIASTNKDNIESNQRVVYGINKKEGMLYRPMLGFERSDIIRYMNTFGLSWIEDSSNCTTDYLRNFIRNNIVPSYNEWLKTKQ